VACDNRFYSKEGAVQQISPRAAVWPRTEGPEAPLRQAMP